MIDIGLNLASPRFDIDRDEVINRAQLAGITHAILTGSDIDSSEQTIALCKSDSQQLIKNICYCWCAPPSC